MAGRAESKHVSNLAPECQPIGQQQGECGVPALSHQIFGLEAQMKVTTGRHLD